MVNYKHGLTKSRTYQSWKSMKQRCLNPNFHKHPTYGGRGVKICKRWTLFKNFLDDMGLRPEGTSLDRYPNPAGDYKPSNCRWATPAQQGINRRKK